MISVTHVVAGLSPSSGGPSRTVVQLCDALAKNSQFDVSLFYQDKNDENAVISENTRVKRYSAKSDSESALKFGIPGMKLLENLDRQKTPDIYHIHGTWSPVLHWASRFAYRKNKTIIVQPRGMLEPWALDFKAWKKSIAMNLYQRRDIERASLLIATSGMEYENFRKLGFTQPVAVIPNGVRIETFQTSDDIGIQSVVKKALFLSRIHPKKGLINLVTAWAKLKPKNWRLVIAGPDEGGHLSEVIRTANVLGVIDAIDFVGEVDGTHKASIYQNADLFVLPTYSENFGVVVAEALSYGLPVITTRGAPWSDLETYGCGWWIDIGIEPLTQALENAISLTDEHLVDMGCRGRVYVQQYDWDIIAQKIQSLYRWVLWGGDCPSCVLIN